MTGSSFRCPQGGRSGVRGVKSRVACWLRRSRGIVQAHFFTLLILAAAVAMAGGMMPALLLLLCSILQLFHGSSAAPAPGNTSSVNKRLRVSQSSLLLHTLAPPPPSSRFGPFPPRPAGSCCLMLATGNSYQHYLSSFCI